MSTSSRQSRTNNAVFLAAFVAGSVPALLYLWREGFSDEAFGLVLRTGARASLLIFVCVLVARPLRQLADSALTRRLLSNRRLVGVAFAGMMTAHLVYLLWFNGFVVAPGGSAVFLLMFLMLVTSYPAPAAFVGPGRWKLLHRTGIYVIAGAFATTIIGGIRDEGLATVYGVLGLLLAGALALRLAAFLAIRRRRTTASGAREST